MGAAAVLVLVALGVGVGRPAPSRAAERADAHWTQTTFKAVHGSVTLHADVLRPANLPADAKTPVVLTVSPYFNHSGQTTDYSPTAQGPSSRFYDFLDLSHLLTRGYTYVMVDLPGFGGSSGCTDWGGPAEQSATHDAVEWAAAQPWSTGKVAVFGKSYDGDTGLQALATRPKGLAAVVSMETLDDTYRYLYEHGVRFPNSIGTPASYQAIAQKPGTLNDSPDYNIRDLPHACDVLPFVQQQNDVESSAFWQARDLRARVRGVTTPVFLTQGLLEDNTKPDPRIIELWNSLAGPKHAWFGQFEHVRGWETDAQGHLKSGQPGFVDQVMRFLDQYLKGIKPSVVDPTVSVQDATGRYRAEAQWPPADMHMWWTQLRTGAYPDDGTSAGLDPGNNTGIWSISPPLDHTVWMAGSPVLDYDVGASPRANLVADLYDIDPAGDATLMSRATTLLRHGSERGTLPMYVEDWPVAAGHRIGLVLSGSNIDWWSNVPTTTQVTVNGARLGLPALANDRTKFLKGSPTPWMATYHTNNTGPISVATINAATTPFVLPPPLVRAASATPSPAPARVQGRVLAVTGGEPPLALLALVALVALATRRAARDLSKVSAHWPSIGLDDWRVRARRWS